MSEKSCPINEARDLSRSAATPKAAEPAPAPAFREHAIHRLGNRAAGRLLQAKMRIGEPDDEFEREADRLSGAVIQRKCAACEGGSTCPKCEEEQKLRMSPGAAAQPGRTSVPDNFLGSLGSGHPLPQSTRGSLERGLGGNFEGVRVHTGEPAGQLAGSIGARAFTVDRDIVFGRGEYAPDTPDGGRLLGHELVHVMQQSGGSAPRTVQRAVSRDFDKIEDKLTYGLFDWAITDKEAHDVLQILKALNPTDLQDTVAAMEEKGFVGRLFSNVSDDDQIKELPILEKIHDLRVSKEKKKLADGTEVEVSATGPCSIEENRTLDATVEETKKWARDVGAKVAEFIAAPAAHAAMGVMLNRYFLHTENNGVMTPAVIQGHAQTIRDNLHKVELQAGPNPWPMRCASPFDPVCYSLALAYNDITRHVVTVCPPFFSHSRDEQIADLFHELCHAYTGVQDRAYPSERMYAYLSPAEAINNAASYELLAREIKLGSNYTDTWDTDVSDCDNAKSDDVKRRFAIGTRMITNALNVLGDPDIGQDLSMKHFKTSDQTKLRQVVDRFKKIDTKFNSKVNFECESSCDPRQTGYNHALGWTVHLCPAFFLIAGDHDRTDELLRLAIDQKIGLDVKALPGTAGYNALSIDDAYDNLGSYVGYARDVTSRWWP
jgi:hypothetical protein